MRANSMSNACANERAISVLARPGKSSIRTWPSARNPSSTSSSASRLPTTARSISPRTRSARPAASSMLSIASDRLQLVDDAGELGEGGPACKAIFRRRPLGAHELPRLRSDELARATGLAVEVDAIARAQPVGRYVAEHRAQAGVQVGGVVRRELELVYESRVSGVRRSPAHRRDGAIEQ